MRLSKEELITKFKNYGNVEGEEPTDEFLSMLEDITDTIDGLSETNERITELETELSAEKDKVKEVEKTWKQKYIDRFGEGTSKPEPNKEPEPDDTEDQEVDVHIDDVLYKDLSK